MNAEEGQTQEGGDAGGQPTQEEMRERLEEQLRKVRVQDLLLESVVSVLNLAARRIGKEDERDLEQGRIGIEAVRALIGLLDPEPAEQGRAPPGPARPGAPRRESPIPGPLCSPRFGGPGCPPICTPEPSTPGNRRTKT